VKAQMKERRASHERGEHKHRKPRQVQL
jgi:hypothetical protein